MWVDGKKLFLAASQPARSSCQYYSFSIMIKFKTFKSGLAWEGLALFLKLHFISEYYWISSFFICNLYTLVPVEVTTCADDATACDANTNGKIACFNNECVGK